MRNRIFFILINEYQNANLNNIFEGIPPIYIVLYFLFTSKFSFINLLSK